MEYQEEKKNGKEEGFGILFFVSGKFKGDRYEGELRNGEFCGKAMYYHATGNRFEGDYKNDYRNGKGIFYWLNGNWREGEYKDGNKHGKSIHHFADGQIEEQIWENN